MLEKRQLSVTLHVLLREGCVSRPFIYRFLWQGARPARPEATMPCILTHVTWDTSDWLDVVEVLWELPSCWNASFSSSSFFPAQISLLKSCPIMEGARGQHFCVFFDVRFFQNILFLMFLMLFSTGAVSLVLVHHFNNPAPPFLLFFSHSIF